MRGCEILTSLGPYGRFSVFAGKSGRSGIGFLFHMVGTLSFRSSESKDSCTFVTDWQEVLLLLMLITSASCCVHSQGLRRVQLQNQQSHLHHENPQRSQHLPEVQASFCRCAYVSDRLIQGNFWRTSMMSFDHCKPDGLAQGSLHIFLHPSLSAWMWNSYQPWPLRTVFCIRWKVR